MTSLEAATSPVQPTVLMSGGLRNLARPWILRIGKLPGMTPWRVGLLATAAFAPMSLVTRNPLMTAVLTAYALGITCYLIDRQEKELRALEPVLDLDEAEFGRVWHELRNHPRRLLWSGWLIGPLTMILVNFPGPLIVAIRAGEPFPPRAIWGVFLASLFWVIFFQMMVVFVRNALAFQRLGAARVRINILDVSSLTPFSRVAIRNLLIFVAGFALAPLSLLDSPDLLLPLFISLTAAAPFCIALLVVPVWAIHKRLVQAKNEELTRVSEALRGNREALLDSPIVEDADQITVTGLVTYRQMVRDVNEWPMDTPEILRFAAYVIIPFLAWVGAALVERAIDLFLQFG